MAVIGAVGFGAVALGNMAASGGAPVFQNAGDDLSGGEPGGSEAPRVTTRGTRDASGEEAADPQEPPQPTAEESSDGASDDAVAPLDIDFNGPGPWLALLGGGVVLVLLGFSLRHSVKPRAG